MHSARGSSARPADAAAWVFSEPSRVRLGRYSAAMRRLTGGEAVSGRVGTWRENRDAIAGYYDDLAAWIVTAPHERPAAPPKPVGLLLPKILLPDFQRVSRVHDRAEADRGATRVMLALERYHAGQGRYPESLAMLELETGAALPVDPWSGTPLVYRVLDSAAGAYLLYAVGEDRADDGGDPGRGPTGPDVIYSPAD